MGLFDGIAAPKNTEIEKDFVRGARKEPLPTDIYNLIVKYAYAQKSKGGAMGVNLVLTTADDREIKVTEWITSGDAKGNSSTYKSVDKKTGVSTDKPLPGFSVVDSLCKMLTGKGILACDNEKRTIKLYDFTAKAEIPVEVDMLVELVGKPVCGAVLHQIQDKRAKNDATGKYEPNGQTFSTNVIEKYLSPDERKTSAEIANSLNADWQEKWLAKWKDQIDDQSTEVKSAGLKGAPAANGEAAPKTSLFG